MGFRVIACGRVSRTFAHEMAHLCGLDYNTYGKKKAGGYAERIEKYCG